jgi:hypothetical protein
VTSVYLQGMVHAIRFDALRDKRACSFVEVADGHRVRQDQVCTDLQMSSGCDPRKRDIPGDIPAKARYYARAIPWFRSTAPRSA